MSFGKEKYTGKHRAGKHRAFEKSIGERFRSSAKNMARAAMVATFGVGIAAAPSVINAPAANAAPVAAWDGVAACESTGNWSINNGNGFYGGLQFTAQTWSGHGGGEFAATADQASKAEQIAIAERVLASQGPGAWPNCSGPLTSGASTESETVPVPAVAEIPQQQEQPVVIEQPNYAPQVAAQVSQYAPVAVEVASPFVQTAVAVAVPPLAPIVPIAAPFVERAVTQGIQDGVVNFAQNNRGGWQMAPQERGQGWGQDRGQSHHDRGGHDKHVKKPCNR